MSAKRRGRWSCPYPFGPGYNYKFLRFPWCLASWLRRMPLWATLLHALGHFGLDVYKVNEQLLMLGILYAAEDGGVLRWQWCYWNGSPLARQIQAIKEGMTPRQALLMYGEKPWG